MIPFGLIAAISSPRMLFAATLFFAPFSATAVVNIGAGENASGVTVYVYFAILLVLRALCDSLFRLRLSIPRAISRPVMYLFLFLTVCAVSILMPLWINGKLEIMSPILIDMTTTPLYFSSKNVTGLVYLFLGIFTATMVARRTLAPDEFVAAVKICTWSGFFVAAWALLQLFCYFLHIPYPSILFNNSATPTAQGFTGTLNEGSLRRLSSVAVEPSIMAASLLTILPFCLVALTGSGHVLSRRADKWILGIMIAALVLSTSSTAFIGLFLIVMIYARYHIKFRRLSILWLVLPWILGGLCIGAYLFIPSVNALINVTLLDKAGGYSALERTKTIVYAFSYFLQYPLLGVGWSSVTSHDTIVRLLANCGLIGLMAFSAFIGSIVMRLLRRISYIENEAEAFASPALLLYIALVVTIVVAVIDGLPYVFGYFWVTLGLAISAPSLKLEHGSPFREGAK
jgi:hypothetical protein